MGSTTPSSRPPAAPIAAGMHSVAGAMAAGRTARRAPPRPGSPAVFRIAECAAHGLEAAAPPA